MTTPHPLASWFQIKQGRDRTPTRRRRAQPAADGSTPRPRVPRPRASDD